MTGPSSTFYLLQCFDESDVVLMVKAGWNFPYLKARATTRLKYDGKRAEIFRWDGSSWEEVFTESEDDEAVEQAKQRSMSRRTAYNHSAIWNAETEEDEYQQALLEEEWERERDRDPNLKYQAIIEEAR